MMEKTKGEMIDGVVEGGESERMTDGAERENPVTREHL